MVKTLNMIMKKCKLLWHQQWVETNPSNICIFPKDIHFYRLMVLHDTDVHRENTDVRLVGFHPPWHEPQFS
jgi:hypothetical protein